MNGVADTVAGPLWSMAMSAVNSMPTGMTATGQLTYGNNVSTSAPQLPVGGDSSDPAYQAGYDLSGLLLGGGDGEAVDLAEGQASSDLADPADPAVEDPVSGDGPSCPDAVPGGNSFTARTLVLLASGKTVAISQLKVGDKVLAADTKTGKDQPETVTAVLVHHDTDLYNLTVKTSTGTEVIHTTSSHLFWDPSLNQWLPASNLKPGTHLKTPDGQAAVVVGGSVPAVHDGWMWDLTIPGNGDHDFYVETASTPILVHNAGGPLASQLPDLTGMSPQQAWQALENHGFTSNNNVSPNGYETFSAPDGSRVTLRYTDGRVTRTAPAISSEGQRYNARYGPDGQRTQAHDTGENLTCG